MKGDVTPMGYRENKRSTLSGDKKFFVPMNNRIATVTGFGSIVVSHKKGGCVVSIKDGRYSIDFQLMEAIEI